MDDTVASGRRVSFRALGTRCQITVSGGSAGVVSAFFDAAIHWVAAFEARYSRFLPESLVSRINASAGFSWVDVDAETDRLLSLCQELVFFTRGAFDPTALPLIQLWDWKSRPPRLPSDAAIEAAQARVGWRKVQRRPGAVFLPEEGMSLDLGGVGKEYAVDRVVQLAQSRGLVDVLVDFGQDVRGSGRPAAKPAWHVGLEDPAAPGSCWTGVAVRDLAVATSGDYARCFEVEGRRYGHILDPRTGRPVDNGCRSVTVLAPSCTIAGALATTAFILGPEAGRRLIEDYFGAEGCLITDHTRHQTRRFHEYITH